jgi:hypothetical protein
MWNFVFATFDFEIFNSTKADDISHLPNIVLISTLTDNKISIEIIN